MTEPMLGRSPSLQKSGRTLSLDAILPMLVRRGIVTINPGDRERCCGMERDSDGFCQHRSYHPIYVEVYGTTPARTPSQDTASQPSEEER